MKALNVVAAFLGGIALGAVAICTGKGYGHT